MTLRACAARVRARLAAEHGFGVIEVLVSALIVVLISLSSLAAIDAAGRTADKNKSRSVASSLAQDDLERMRAIKITDLAAMGANSAPRTVTVDGESYSVQSKAEYLAGTAGSDNCASDDEAPKYLKMTSTVTWPNMGASKPVVSNSLRATPSGTIGDFGSLAVDINGRAGAGQSGIAVTITPDATAAANGGVTTTANTNSKGCVLFGYIASGRYTVSFSKSGYVLAPNPNNASVSDETVVAADSIASKTYTYDQAGKASATYVTNASYGSTTWGTSTQGTGFTIQNALLGSPDYKTVSHTAAASYTTPTFAYFPFTGAYEAYSGLCTAYKPGSGDVQSMAIGPGGTGTASVREFRLRVQVQRRTSTSGGNYATMPNDAKTTVKVTPTSSGCTDTVNAAWVSNTGSSSSTASANYSTYEAIVPWGSYTVCAQYNNTTSNRAKTSVNNISTTASTGTTYGTRIEVPYNQTSGYTC